MAAVLYECDEHKFFIAGEREDKDYTLAEEIEAHEQLHTADHEAWETTTPAAQPEQGRWKVWQADDGFWHVSRAGQPTIPFLTFAAAHNHIATTALVEMAGDEWEVLTALDTHVMLRHHGDPLTNQFRGPSALRQACAFLRSWHADHARRAALTATRDQHLAEADVLTDRAAHIAVALASERVA